MKYLCLVYLEEKKLYALSKSESEALIEESLAFDDALWKSGHYVVSDALQPVHTATTVRVQNGKVSVTDGPFAETKEQLGGVRPDRGQGPERGHPGRLEDPARALRVHRSAADHGAQPAVAATSGSDERRSSMCPACITTVALRGGVGFGPLPRPNSRCAVWCSPWRVNSVRGGIHVAHVVIDGLIWSQQTRERFDNVSQSSCLDPDAVADAFQNLIAQDRSAWTHELDLRPAQEKF